MTSNLGKPSLADLPAFWVLLFAVVAVAALAAIGPKYARRQAKLEINYEGRVAAAGREDSTTSTADEPGSLVPVTTLTLVFAVIVVASAGRLAWQFGRRTDRAGEGDVSNATVHEARQP